MKKSGKTNRVEPMDTSWAESFPDCVAIFQRDGWFDLFKRINRFHLELSYRFPLGFYKNTVSFDILKFELTIDLIEEATGIASDG